MKIVEPGAIKTDFAGRSFDFSNDDNLKEYQEIVGKVMSVFGPAANMGADPVVVAEVIFQAATDGTSQLRYTAGEDAKQIVANRKAVGDDAFFGGIKQQFSL